MSDPRSAAHARFTDAVAHAEAGRLDEALRLIEEALAVDPRAVYRFARADFLASAGRRAEARAALEALAGEQPEFGPAASRLGELLLDDGEVAPALARLRVAQRLRPRHAPTAIALARAQIAAGQPTEAEATARGALDIAPDLPQAHAVLGHALQRQAAHTRAEAEFAIAAEGSHDAQLWLTLANARLSVGRVAGALEAFARAEVLDPGDADQIGSARLLAMHYDDRQSLESMFAAHTAWALRHAPVVPARPNAEPIAGRRIRVGYVSPRLHRCSAGALLLPVLENHDRDAFEVHCYAASDLEDEVTARMRAAATSWCEAWKLDDEALAARMRADRLDIAIDLAGHTPGHRLGAFARRPAPVAVTWLDYFDTTGLAAIDALLTDAWHSPEADAQRFTEELVRLPGLRWCWGPPEYAPPVAPTPCLARDAFTFGSFNRLSKLSRSTLELWCDVLAAVPGSRLILKSGTLDLPEEHAPVIRRFEERGIDPRRVEPRGQSPHAEMLGQYADIDVALDSVPYNGGIVTLESLWMGRPVLTLRGNSLISRQSSAILSAAGLDRWVASDRAHFVELAVRAASDRLAHASECAQLRARVAASGITDSQAFVQAFEAALLGLWRRYAG